MTGQEHTPQREIQPDPAAVLRRAVELEAALIARDAGGFDAVRAAAEWVIPYLPDVHDGRAVEVVAGWLLCAVNPRLAKPREWSRQLDSAAAPPDIRQAYRTLGLAVADILGGIAVRGRELLAAGARHLWAGVTAADRGRAEDLVPFASRAWGWAVDESGDPPEYDGPRPALTDPMEIDNQWRTRVPGQPRRPESGSGGINFLVDSIPLTGGERLDVYRDDVKPSRSSLPSVCPRAEPKLHVKPGESHGLLPDIEFRFRDLELIGPDDSIHWVGRQGRRQTWCLCELNPAALVRPRPAEWKDIAELRQAICAMVRMTRAYAEAPRRGVGLRESDRLRLDYHSDRIHGLAAAQGLSHIVTFDSNYDQSGAVYSNLLLPVESVGSTAISPDNIIKWMSNWKKVWYKLDTRLELLDQLAQSAGKAGGLAPSGYPLDAPAGTPQPIKSAFEATARLLFDAVRFWSESGNGAGSTHLDLLTR